MYANIYKVYIIVFIVSYIFIYKILWMYKKKNNCKKPKQQYYNNVYV